MQEIFSICIPKGALEATFRPGVKLCSILTRRIALIQHWLEDQTPSLTAQALSEPQKGFLVPKKVLSQWLNPKAATLRRHGLEAGPIINHGQQMVRASKSWVQQLLKKHFTCDVDFSFIKRNNSTIPTPQRVKSKV